MTQSIWTILGSYFSTFSSLGSRFDSTRLKNVKGWKEETQSAAGALMMEQHQWVRDPPGSSFWAASPELGWPSLAKGQGPGWQSHHSPWVTIALDLFPWKWINKIWGAQLWKTEGMWLSESGQLSPLKIEALETTGNFWPSWPKSTIFSSSVPSELSSLKKNVYFGGRGGGRGSCHRVN